MNHSNQHIDDLFSNQLNGFEESYDPKAWDDMLAKLEQDDAGSVAPIILTKKFNIKKITIMTISGIIMASVFYSLISNKQLGSTNGIPQNTNEINEVKVAVVDSSEKNRQPIAKNDFIQPQADIPETLSGPELSKSLAPSKQKSVETSAFSPAKDLILLNNMAYMAIPQMALKGIEMNILSVNASSKPDFSLFPTKTQKSSDTSNTRLKKLLGDPDNGYRYNGPWIGIHFAYAPPIGAMRKKGYKEGWGGNIELMSKDLMRNPYYGAFIGGSIGILGAGSGNTSNVLLQTPNNDSGYTYLYNMNVNFDLIARFELGSRRLKPYGDVLIGARVMNTYQRIDSKKTIEGFQSSDEIANTATGLHFGVSGGLRYHLVPGVSLDGRLTYYSGEKFDWANVDKSTYQPGTATYSLSKSEAQLSMLHFRLGFLFDLGEIQWGGCCMCGGGSGVSGSNPNPNNDSQPVRHRTNNNVRIGNGSSQPPKNLKIQVPRKD